MSMECYVFPFERRIREAAPAPSWRGYAPEHAPNKQIFIPTTRQFANREPPIYLPSVSSSAYVKEKRRLHLARPDWFEFVRRWLLATMSIQVFNPPNYYLVPALAFTRKLRRRKKYWKKEKMVREWMDRTCCYHKNHLLAGNLVLTWHASTSATHLFDSILFRGDYTKSIYIERGELRVVQLFKHTTFFRIGSHFKILFLVHFLTSYITVFELNQFLSN